MELKLVLTLLLLIKGSDSNFFEDMMSIITDRSFWLGGPKCSESAKDVFFVLYTRDNPKDGQVLQKDANQIENTFFNASNPTRILIHGWMNDHTAEFNTEVTAAYLKHGNFNVIAVDWKIGSMIASFGRAKSYIPCAASAVAKFLKFLASSEFVSLDEIVLVGHSLGAHLAGLTGKKLSTLKAIVGLDPAALLFSVDKPAERLARNDASYVEVIHSSAIGMTEPIGDSDFYPNYGRIQPGCSMDFIECSHSRSYKFFAESLVNDNFSSEKCQNMHELKRNRCSGHESDFKMGGEPTDASRNGIFVLTTNPQSPFARG